MSNSEIPIPVSVSQIFDKNISVQTNKRNVIQVKKTTIHILEMEDVLFHHNSAVLMPENPEGPLSKSGSPTPQQLQVTGIRSLALAFKQLQLFPNQTILVAGHADRSGEASYNFDLSELRAKNVQYLLKSGKELWAPICESRHQIEDYQQILAYYNVTLGWNCNPGTIDNTWGQKTEDATLNFITLYNFTFAYKLEPIVPIDENIVTAIKNDPKHIWPAELWSAVYDLYQHDLIQAVTGKHVADDVFNGIRASMTDMDPAHPYVGCGESFPISKKSDYRSQKDRRVEIMFFDTNEAVTLACPNRKNTVHEKKECILQTEDLFITKPIDPAQYFTAQYHLQFLYYDTISNDYKPFPQGLSIKVFKDGVTDKQTIIKYANNVYEVSAIGLTHTPREKDIHFQFEMDDCWIYTANASTDPVIMTKAQVETAISPKTLDQLTHEERLHYVPIAGKWDSRNWPCELNGAQDDFEKQVMQLTSEAQPIVFNMNMLVLLEKNGATQAIHDADHFNAPRDLEGGKSRVKVFVIDPVDATLSLYKTGADDNTSRLPFARNCIPDTINNIACVFFRNGFYVPSDSHTVEENKWLDKKFCIGARAAVRVDNAKQANWEMFHNGNEHAYTGDYDIHYLHHLYALNNNPVSYCIIYVSINFMRDSGNGAVPIPTQADVNNFIDKGVYNAMARYNDKKYFFEEQTPGADTTIIMPFYFFDERETFIIPDAEQPSGIDFDDIVQASVLMKHPSVAKARRAAYGGKPKFLAFIIKDSNPANKDGAAYAWPIRNNSGNYDFSIFQLHESAYDTQTNSLLGGLPIAEYGVSYGGCTFAHELGHATSLADEYINEQQFFAHQETYPNISQFFEPYTMQKNKASLMYYMAPPRLHHLWYQVHAINNQIGTGVLNAMLSGKAFQIKYDHGAGTMTYHRPLNGPNAANKDIRIPDKTNPQYPVFNAGGVLKRLYLALYYVGQDESSVNNFHALQNNYEYNGVLCVRVFLNFTFTSIWTDNERDQKMFDLYDFWQNNNEKFRLVNGAAPLQSIYIYFLVGFTVPGESDVGQSNFTLNFRKGETETSGMVSTPPNMSVVTPDLAAKIQFNVLNNALTYTGRMTDAHHTSLQGMFISAADQAVITDLRNRSRSTARIPNNNGTVIVREDVSMEELQLHMLNMDHGDDFLTGLRFLKTWTDTETGNNYTLEEI